MPATNPEIVLLIPVPEMAPGLIVQFPAGKPFKTTLPFATPQLGWVIVPTEGGAGVTGCKFIIAFAEPTDVHPTELVTLNAYVPAAKPGKVILRPDPAIAPGLIVQFPAGNPLISRLPVDTAQLGCAFMLIIGADGVTGCGFIVTSSDITEVQPDAFVTV